MPSCSDFTHPAGASVSSDRHSGWWDRRERRTDQSRSLKVKLGGSYAQSTCNTLDAGRGPGVSHARPAILQSQVPLLRVHEAGYLDEGIARRARVLEETWSFQLVPERLLPSIFAFLSVLAISQLEHFLVHSLTITGPWSIQGSLLLAIQFAILLPIFAHTLRRH
jgi:hypothetical protein